VLDLPEIEIGDSMVERGALEKWPGTYPILSWQAQEFICVTLAKATWTNSLGWLLRAGVFSIPGSHRHRLRKLMHITCSIRAANRCALVWFAGAKIPE
jgi:hypothetical protein